MSRQVTRVHLEARNNVPFMARHTINQVDGVFEICAGACTPNLFYFEIIPIENLPMSDFRDRQVVEIIITTHSVIWFPE